MTVANKNLFKSQSSKRPPTTVKNAAGGRAYERGPKLALAQMAATGCLGGTFYTSPEQELSTILDLCSQNSPEFVAKAAVYARKRGFMKDAPALMVAHLASLQTTEGRNAFTQAFPLVMDNAKMVRNFVQIIRSGQAGRKSFGSRPKKMVQAWFNGIPDHALFNSSIGQDPSLGDIISLVHPLPRTDSRRALYGYLKGTEGITREAFERLPQDERVNRHGDPRFYFVDDLPPLVQAYEKLKRGEWNGEQLPRVNFQMLTSLKLTREQWAEVAMTMSWYALRMNLNTLLRHGVFDIPGMTPKIVARLTDPESIRKAKAFPYQLLTAYLYADDKLPRAVKNALQDAMEVACENVPLIGSGRILICPDVSGSMKEAITGKRDQVSKINRIHVAALFAAALMRKNPDADIMPFANEVRGDIKFNPRDSIMTNAERVYTAASGGTRMSAPLLLANAAQRKYEAVLYISDDESWMDSEGRHYGPCGKQLWSATGYGWPYTGQRHPSTKDWGATQTLEEWNKFERRNHGAKLVCIDLTPNTTMQVIDRPDILNVGGFSDAVFTMVDSFVKGEMTPEHWVGEIERVNLHQFDPTPHEVVQVEESAEQLA
jgi:60 kDa SS-A/Ro ribonucleoprotein